MEHLGNIYLFFYARLEKRDVLWEHLLRAGGLAGGQLSGRRPQGFRSLSQRVFIRSLSNLVNMLVCTIPRPSSITSQIHSGTPELWPFNGLNYGFRLLCQRVLSCIYQTWWICFGNNISTKFYYQPNSLCTPEFWPLKNPKLGFSLSTSNSFHPVF